MDFNEYNSNDYTKEGLERLSNQFRTLQDDNLKYLQTNIYGTAEKDQALLDKYVDYYQRIRKEELLLNNIVRVKTFLDDQDKYDVNDPRKHLFISGPTDSK